LLGVSWKSCLGAALRGIWSLLGDVIVEWGLGQILLGDRFFENIAWGCDLFGEADFDDFLAWGLAWGGFAWGCEAGVFRNLSNI